MAASRVASVAVLMTFSAFSAMGTVHKVMGPMGPGPNDAGLSRHHIVHGVEASLRRLQTEDGLIKSMETREAEPIGA